MLSAYVGKRGRASGSSQIDLREKFNEYFEIVHARTGALRREVYKLRFQVYCLETGFERKEDCKVVFEDGREIWLEEDKYDRRSDHYLIRHRRTGLYAATVRMVLPHPDDPMEIYPIEENCTLDAPVKDAGIRRHLAEVSRFAVSKDFKRRRGEAGTLAGIASMPEVHFEPEERRMLPHMTLGLFAAVARMTCSHDINYWYAVMEPALLRFLYLFGIRFQPIGPDVDYHGLRRPCLATLEGMSDRIRKTNPAVWDLITEGGRYSR